MELAFADLAWLTGASLVAGTVYGFAGFGAALIFMPLAVMRVPAEVALAALSIASISSFVTLVPRAWTEADRRACLWMLGTALCFIPFGLMVLRAADPVALRWVVSLLALATLGLLLTGWRYRQSPGLPAWLGVGAGVGFVGGATGLNGPVLILFQLGGPDMVARTRANTIIVLTCSSLAFMPVMAAQGALGMAGLVAGATQIVPYGLGALVGRRLFNPAHERLYRTVAYVLIAVAAGLGLPIRGG